MMWSTKRPKRTSQAKTHLYVATPQEAAGFTERVRVTKGDTWVVGILGQERKNGGLLGHCGFLWTPPIDRTCVLLR